MPNARREIQTVAEYASSVLRTRAGQAGLAVVLLLICARIALPYALRPVLVSQADRALHGRIELEDLDLSLLRGGVTLHGLVVHAQEPPLPAIGASIAETPVPPLFTAERLWAQISWIALIGKTVRVEDVELDGFRVHLERTLDGHVLPEPRDEGQETPPPPDPPEDPPSGWAFVLDRLRLRDGSVSYRDRTTVEGTQQIDLRVPEVLANGLQFGTATLSENPGRLTLRVGLGEGEIDLDARVESHVEGPRVVTEIALTKIPIASVRPYIAELAWRDLDGRLDARLTHRFAFGGGIHTASGTLSLSDLEAFVSELEAPALAWKELRVDVETVDLVERQVALRQVALTGGRLPVGIAPAIELPLLAPRATNPAPPPPVESAPPLEETPASQEAPAWSWRIGEVSLLDTRVQLLGADSPLPLGIEAKVRDLSSRLAQRWPLTMQVTQESGTVSLDGSFAVAPLALDANLQVANLEIAPLLARTARAGSLVRGGTLRADLTVGLAEEAPQAGETPAGLRIAGSLGVAGLDLGAPENPEDFGVAWKDLDLTVRELRMPRLLERGDGSSSDTRLELARIRLVEPTLRITRDPQGIVVPFRETSTPQNPPPPAADSASSPSFEVLVDDARIESARALLEDRTVSPAFRSILDRIDLNGARLRWPERSAQLLELDLRGLGGAELELRGGIDQGDSKLTAQLRQLGLEQFNPYLSDAGYSVVSGSLSVESEATIQASAYDAPTAVVFSQLDVAGAEGSSAFQQTFGLPLSLALSLLTDSAGQISLSVPLSGDREGTSVGLLRVGGQALRQALVGALTSPLKMLGAVVNDGRVESLRPAAIEFAPGAVEPTARGRERIDELARLLEATRDVKLTLAGAASPEDVVALKERALLAELRDVSALRAVMTLGERGTRAAVQSHLEAKQAGRAIVPLSSNDAAWLEQRLADREIPPQDLRDLATARATRAQELLESVRGQANRVAIGPPADDPSAAEGGVRIELGFPSVAAPSPAVP